MNGDEKVMEIIKSMTMFVALVEGSEFGRHRSMSKRIPGYSPLFSHDELKKIKAELAAISKKALAWYEQMSNSNLSMNQTIALDREFARFTKSLEW